MFERRRHDALACRRFRFAFGVRILVGVGGRRVSCRVGFRRGASLRVEFGLRPLTGCQPAARSGSPTLRISLPSTAWTAAETLSADRFCMRLIWRGA